MRINKMNYKQLRDNPTVILSKATSKIENQKK